MSWGGGGGGLVSSALIYSVSLAAVSNSTRKNLEPRRNNNKNAKSDQPRPKANLKMERRTRDRKQQTEKTLTEGRTERPTDLLTDLRLLGLDVLHDTRRVAGPRVVGGLPVAEDLEGGVTPDTELSADRLVGRVVHVELAQPEVTCNANGKREHGLRQRRAARWMLVVEAAGA